jgi:hypothetical protein
VKLIADITAGKLIVNDAKFPVSCRVRTFRDGTRGAAEVVYSIPDGLPYDPRPFPKGLWHITGIDWQKDKGFDYSTYGPVKIRTDAWQLVEVWELDADGDYLRETARLVKDTGYWLHYSGSSTTLGCIRLESPDEAAALGKALERALKEGPVEFEAV